VADDGSSADVAMIGPVSIVIALVAAAAIGGGYYYLVEAVKDPQAMTPTTKKGRR
jgi:hypothetical protein